MTDPFKIEGPAQISFSGGRTSAYMLWRIIQAHGGTLPADITVAFANTGKEREETLRFVHDCETRWAVHIDWIQRTGDRVGALELVGYNSAARDGEPFQALIDKKSRLPNWQERWCTQYLKVEPLQALALTHGYKVGEYTEVIGLRYDEGTRILRGMGNAEKYKRRVAYPLSKAKVVKADVMTFWAAQPFDLQLKPWEGNCDLCFMKGKGIRKRIIRDKPGSQKWWIDNEVKRGGFFDRRTSYAELANECRLSPDLFEPIEPEEYDTECGVSCAPN